MCFCHHGTARPKAAYGGTASNMGAAANILNQ